MAKIIGKLYGFPIVLADKPLVPEGTEISMTMTPLKEEHVAAVKERLTALQAQPLGDRCCQELERIAEKWRGR